MNNQQRIEGAVNFFDSLYGNVNRKAWSYLWIKRGDNKETFAFEVSNDAERLKMAERAIKLSNAGYDVYFGICTTDTAPAKHSRVKTEQVTLQTCLWADIDCQGGNHTDTGKYPTIEQARAFLPLEPSILICSGYGLHAYYLLDNPLELKTDDERRIAVERNRNLLDAIRSNAGAYASVVDAVQDLPRVLRVPFAFNYKLQDSPALVNVIDDKDFFKVYSIADFDKFKTAVREKAKPSSTNIISHSVKPDEGFEIARIQAALDCIDATPYDIWYRVGMALKAESESYFDLWLEWSKTATNFKSEEDCRKHWQSFNGQGVTLSTVFYMAGEAGYDAKAFYKEWQSKSAPLTNPKMDIEKDVSTCYNDDTENYNYQNNSTDGGVFSSTIVSDNADDVKKGFDTMDLISTKQVADMLGVSAKTVASWRTRKLFGVPFFTADVKRGDTWYYLRERVEQLKSVYQFGILQKMYKLARLSDSEYFSDDFQKSATSHDIKKGKYADYLTTEEVAKILGVNAKRIERWRDNKIFLEDIVDHDGTYLYSRERVKQFKKVFRTDKTVDTNDAQSGQDSTTPLESTGAPVKKKVKLPDVDFEYEVPTGYVLDTSGLYVLDSKKDKPTLKRICNPLIVSRRIVNVDDETHKIELSSLQDKWIRATFSNSILTTKNKIPTVSDAGFYDITSNNAGLIVDYISRFVDTNRETIPTAQSVSTVGWRADEFVYPEIGGKFELDDTIRPQAKYFAPKGDKKPLLALTQKLKKIDNFNVALGAVLAAPLVDIVGGENIVLHFHGRAGCGKTMLSKAVASLFINPFVTGALPSANSTASALEYFFNGRRDLPCLIEDFDSIDATDKRTQAVMRNLPYNFGNGIGRSRAKAQGGLRKTVEYRGALITNGEQPLTTDSSKGGAKRRCIEIECQADMIKPELAAEIDSITRENHACIGKDWIKYIQHHKAEIQEKCKEIRHRFFRQYADEVYNKVPRHVDQLSTIATATIFFNKFAGFALIEDTELNCAGRIIEKLPSNDEISDVHRVRQFICDWILSHLDNLQRDEKGDTRAFECYGINFADYFAIYPTVMKKALTDAGYAPSVLKQLADEGWLIRNGNRTDRVIRTADGLIHVIAIPRDKIYGENESCYQSENTATKP